MPRQGRGLGIYGYLVVTPYSFPNRGCSQFIRGKAGGVGIMKIQWIYMLDIANIMRFWPSKFDTDSLLVYYVAVLYIPCLGHA